MLSSKYSYVTLQFVLNTCTSVMFTWSTYEISTLESIGLWPYRQLLCRKASRAWTFVALFRRGLAGSLSRLCSSISGSSARGSLLASTFDWIIGSISFKWIWTVFATCKPEPAASERVRSTHTSSSLLNQLHAPTESRVQHVKLDRHDEYVEIGNTSVYSFLGLVDARNWEFCSSRD